MHFCLKIPVIIHRTADNLSKEFWFIYLGRFGVTRKFTDSKSICKMAPAVASPPGYRIYQDVLNNRNKEWFLMVEAGVSQPL